MKTRTLRLGWFLAAIATLFVTSACMSNPIGLDEVNSRCHLMCE